MSKEATEQPEPVVIKAENQPRRWNVGSIFWGLLLVLVGTLALLDNLNVINVNFANIWQLWPVLIIGAGLSLLSLKGWVGGLVSFVAAVALLGLVTFAVVDNPWYSGVNSASQQTATESVSAGTAKKLETSINTGAATIDVSSSQEEKGVTVTQKSTALSLAKSTETRDGTLIATFESKATRAPWIGAGSNELDVALTRSIPIALKINTGATTFKGDLSKARLVSLDIDTGASTIELRLGAVEDRQDIQIDAGVSSITLYIPKEAGLRIDADKGLSSTDFEGVTKRGDSIYESDGFADAKKQITIRADIGVSKFEIKRY